MHTHIYLVLQLCLQPQPQLASSCLSKTPPVAILAFPELPISSTLCSPLCSVAPNPLHGLKPIRTFALGRSYSPPRAAPAARRRRATPRRARLHLTKERGLGADGRIVIAVGTG